MSRFYMKVLSPQTVNLAFLLVPMYLSYTFSGLAQRMRREGARRREREGARAVVSTLWVLAQIYLLVNSPGIHISPILYVFIIYTS
jgi:hypothetical protein